MRPAVPVVVLSAAVLLAVPVAAYAAVSDWSAGQKAKVRLIAAGVGQDGMLSAAIEIALPSGWDTYWRTPGEGGIAPVFNFTTSRNLQDATVSYPLPQRMRQGDVVSNVYTGDVVLPIRASVPDVRSAIDMSVSVDLGVCQAVCVPDHVEARLVVPAGRTDGAAAQMIAAAQARVPGPPQPGILAVNSLARIGGDQDRPAYRIGIIAPDAGNATVFVEAPGDGTAGVPTLVAAAGNNATFDVSVEREAATAAPPDMPLRITIAADGRAVEQTIAGN